METIAVLDYGASNMRSVTKALEYVSSGTHNIVICDQPETLLSADRVVFPGQGAIGQCMRKLKQRGLDEVLPECIKNKPFLGICLGLQSLLQLSEEDGGTAGLNIIAGKVVKFLENTKDDNGSIYKIPHMGWNKVMQRQNHPMWQGIESGTLFYFVHSYYVQSEDQQYVAATTNYVTEFTSAIANDNLFAVQFHPEKSQQAGLRLLDNFLHW